MNKFLLSSVDPSKLSATVTGLIISLASVVILIAGHFGITLTTEAVTAYAAHIGEAIGSIVFIFGLLRKIVMLFVTKSVTPVLAIPAVTSAPATPSTLATPTA